jgi:hypothetical protein
MKGRLLGSQPIEIQAGFMQRGSLGCGSIINSTLLARGDSRLLGHWVILLNEKVYPDIVGKWSCDICFFRETLTYLNP